MKFIIDNALSPKVSYGLRNLGYDTVHVRDYKLQKADDETIFLRALKENRILISADSDFGFILSKWQLTFPSLILFRHGAERNPALQIDLIKNNMKFIKEDLKSGSIVVIEKRRIRIRKLPLGES